MERTGPSYTNPWGYANGPVARTKLTIVADDSHGVRGFLRASPLSPSSLFSVIAISYC